MNTNGLNIHKNHSISGKLMQYVTFVYFVYIKCIFVIAFLYAVNEAISIAGRFSLLHRESI